MHSPLGMCESSVNACKIYGFVKKANYFCGATPEEKMVAIFTAASLPLLSFCFFFSSFLSQHLDCSISHWIILGRTRKQASGGEIKQPLADPTRLWRNGGKKKVRAISLTLPKALARMSESENDATEARHSVPLKL